MKVLRVVRVCLPTAMIRYIAWLFNFSLCVFRAFRAFRVSHVFLREVTSCGCWLLAKTSNHTPIYQNCMSCTYAHAAGLPKCKCDVWKIGIVTSTEYETAIVSRSMHFDFCYYVLFSHSSPCRCRWKAIKYNHIPNWQPTHVCFEPYKQSAYSSSPPLLCIMKRLHECELWPAELFSCSIFAFLITIIIKKKFQFWYLRSWFSFAVHLCVVVWVRIFIFFTFFSCECEHDYSRLSPAQSFFSKNILLHFWYIDVFYYVFFFILSFVRLSFSPHSRIISYDCFVYCVWIARVYIFRWYTVFSSSSSLRRCGGFSLAAYILFSFFSLSVYMHMCMKRIKCRTI